MRQDDILAALRRDGPMTSTQVLNALMLSMTPNCRTMLHNRMRKLLRKGLVRRKGYTPEWHPETIWEAVE